MVAHPGLPGKVVPVVWAAAALAVLATVAMALLHRTTRVVVVVVAQEGMGTAVLVALASL